MSIPDGQWKRPQSHVTTVWVTFSCNLFAGEIDTFIVREVMKENNPTPEESFLAFSIHC